MAIWALLVKVPDLISKVLAETEVPLISVVLPTIRLPLFWARIVLFFVRLLPTITVKSLSATSFPAFVRLFLASMTISAAFKNWLLRLMSLSALRLAEVRAANCVLE